MAQEDGPVAAIRAGTSREAFQRFLAGSIARQEQLTEAEAQAAKAEIDELSRRLVGLERRLRTSAGRLAELRSMGDVEGFAGEQFDRITSLPGVRSCELTETSLLVQTEPIEVEWEGQRYRLGEYRLRLDLQGDVRVDSVDQAGPKPGWDHPHVQAGLPCLGNVRPGLLKLIGEYELALAVQLLLDFLGTYQPETAYTPIKGWPLA